MAHVVVHEGYFLKEGSWVRSWKRRYYEILQEGKIEYRASKESSDLCGFFDISGRIECSRSNCAGAQGFLGSSDSSVGLSIKSTSTGRTFNVVVDSEDEYKTFLMGVAQASKFNNIYVSTILQFGVCYHKCHFECDRKSRTQKDGALSYFRKSTIHLKILRVQMHPIPTVMTMRIVMIAVRHLRAMRRVPLSDRRSRKKNPLLRANDLHKGQNIRLSLRITATKTLGKYLALMVNLWCYKDGH